MRKIFFTTILLFLALGQVWGETYPQGTPIFADIHSCGNWITESSTTGFRLWYGDGESDYEDIYGTNIAIGSNLYYAIVERDDVIKIQLMRMKNDHSETWNSSPISTVEEGKDVIVMTESGWSWTCSWQTSTTFYVTPSTLSYDNSASWDAEKTLYANIQVGASEYVKLAMESDGHNYSGAPIYKTTFYSPFGGVHRIQFQVYDGGEFKGEKIFVKTDPEPDWSHSECLTNISHKIYNGTSWLTYGKDITIYAIPEDAAYGLSTPFRDDTHKLLANVKIGSTGDGEWLGVWPVFEKTAYQYNQKWIYKATVFAKYNVIFEIQFQEKLKNDESYVSQCDFNPGYQCNADDLDGKIFGGIVNTAFKWYDYAPDTYTVELHPNEGSIWEGNVDSYTFGVGATLPTNVTKWGYDFAGWYDNEDLDGDPVTAITTSDSGNKDYYAKWTSIAQIVSHPKFLAAQEGDIITVTVTGVHTSAAIYLQYTNGTTIANRSISETGTYAFQLSAAAAAEIRTNGLLVTGQNFTFSDVDILYRKTIWSGSFSDNSGWAETAVDKSIFSGLSGGDFLGFNISAINDGNTWHQYAIRADYDNVLSGTRTETGVAIHQLSADHVTALADSNRIDITAQYLDISNLYSYTHTRVYTVEEHTNGGRIWADSVGSYTFGVGATLPTNVTKWNHNFGGWYDNSSFEGEPVTTITTTDTGNKEYYAKWTSILKEYPVASHPELLTVQEGDIIVVNVTSTQTSSKIYLYGLDYSYTEIENRDIASTGKHIFQLSADAAANLRNYGFFVAGNNFTFDDVEIRYRKTIWTGPLNAEDNWEEVAVEKSIFSGLSDGDFLGFDISKINTGEYHQYAIRADGVPVLGGSCTDAGVGVYELSAANVTALQNATTADIVAQYLEIAHLYAYSGIFVIYRTGDAPVGGGIETFAGGSIDSPIEYRMKVHTLDQWYSLYLPFDVDAIKVIEDGVYYDIQPYYRPNVGDPLYQGHYIIRTPAKTEDFEIANFSDWRDPDDYVFTPSGYTPYVIMWHNLYFQGKYIAFFGHKDSAIPEAMTVGERPTKDSVVNVYGNDAMVSGSVVDGYTLEADYGNGAWLREETIGDSRTVLPFECYLRANAKTTPIFKVVRKQDTTTGIDQITNDKSPMTNKKLINGQVVILRDNKMYNILGIEIQ